MPLDAPNPLSEEDMRRFFRDAEKDQELIASNPSDLAGGVDIPVRLSDLEVDGISGEVIYPQGIFKSFASPDPGYQAALTGVYNDWYHEIFGEHPDKFVASALLPMVDIPSAVEEAETGIEARGEVVFRAGQHAHASLQLRRLRPVLGRS